MCEFEFHCWKLGKFIENKTGHILNLMDEISNVFITQAEWGKIKFGKHWELCAYHIICGFGKVLLAYYVSI